MTLTAAVDILIPGGSTVFGEAQVKDLKCHFRGTQARQQAEKQA
jgi:hypothetical protein